MEETISLYDERYYPVANYVEHKCVINKEDLLDAFATDIINRYIDYRTQLLQTKVPVVPLVDQSKAVDSPTDLRIGYILYIPTDVNIKKKMNKLLNYVIQFKNPNIYVKSYWEILETIDNISKIKIKTIVLENNKDYAIKMLVNELIYNSKKKDKKYNKYLEKIVTNNSQCQPQVPAPK
jgi:hypothetical protein